MYKNAGIQSTTEAVQRLINGEKFYLGGMEISFNPSLPHPFRNGESDLVRGWDHYKQWEVPCQWYEDLGEGVLCWVWDGNEEPRRRVGVVTRYVSESVFKFSLKSDAWFEHAEPMTAEEVKKFLWGEK